MEVNWHWRLSDYPFSDNQHDWFYRGKPQNRTLAYLTRCLAQGTPVVCLASRGGCGATTLLRQLSRCVGLDSVAIQFVMSDANQCRNVADIAAQINQLCSDSMKHGIRTVWICDGDNGNVEKIIQDLASLPMLSVLVATKQNDSPEQPRVSLDNDTVRLAPFDLQDSKSFLEQSLLRVGGREPVFTERAIRQLHHQSGGRVRRLAQLAGDAMKLAVIDGSTLVDWHLVEQVGQTDCCAA